MLAAGGRRDAIEGCWLTMPIARLSDRLCAIGRFAAWLASQQRFQSGLQCPCDGFVRSLAFMPISNNKSKIFNFVDTQASLTSGLADRFARHFHPPIPWQVLSLCAPIHRIDARAAFQAVRHSHSLVKRSSFLLPLHNSPLQFMHINPSTLHLPQETNFVAFVLAVVLSSWIKASISRCNSAGLGKKSSLNFRRHTTFSRRANPYF